jgi:hypothetical protein
MRTEYRVIDNRTFKIVYNDESHMAEVYENNEFCFEMNNEYDTDTENQYIKCWCDLENY